ncbi:hypothetical protein DSM106972_035790 [Dulcicalothrix desertica PCC 7102]|uniref:Glycosyltransferase 2-like domain-containing protein n=1 Tax=Dulcicalothrix desertica PCC 7102 TaxID=232991 RepID=A0A3S1B607_9CYAN|nr:glycosyltransferase family 2 protein [Dulcicalothrix desertica]RUT05572.1 hypothetical protein DSM106972_035790 [Dulcicalothrix desertica PCC 7102]TWH54668.1 glycosyltransferase involved in cell wall biosynthesis [Dulcicalothrix desertica PCC 7102]
MKISIITPVYNAVNTIEKTILSVINQQIEFQLEYIIVDGKSNDGTIEIIKKYFNRISVFISETDKGVYDAMNKGLAIATGDIIGIINADDWYNDGAFKIVEKTFLDNTNIEISYSPIHNYFNNEYLNTFVPGSLENLIFKFTINHPSCFVRKEVYQKVGIFDLKYSMAADYDFIFRAYTMGINFYHINTPLVSYSLNGVTGKPLTKFKQIYESWKVASSFVDKKSNFFLKKRLIFYIVWMLKELLALPIKLLIKPHLARKLKSYIRSILGGLPADKYGAW